MRFPTQFPSPRVLFSRFDCPIWVVAFFFVAELFSDFLITCGTFSWKMSFPYSMDHDSSEAREKERVPVKKLVLDIKWSKYSLFSFRE